MVPDEFDKLIQQINKLNLALCEMSTEFEKSDDSELFEEISFTSETRCKKIKELLSTNELTNEQLVQKKAVLEEVALQDQHLLSLYMDKKAEVKGELMKFQKSGKGIKAYKKAT